MNQSLSLLPPVHRQVWLQALGRGLCQAGHGLLQFYMPIVFVNSVGLSATAVGIGLSSASVASIIGHFAGGTLVDSSLGRKGTLLASIGLSILASLILVVTHHLPMLILANLLLGLSMGFYWTAADTAVMDVTSAEDRHQAFAILGLTDHLGIGMGILGGGALLAWLHTSQHLFIVSGGISLLFLVLAQVTIAETKQNITQHDEMMQGWMTALRDRSLWMFVLVNSLFTTYIALVNSILPLYFTNFLTLSTADLGTASGTVASLFTWGYIGLGAAFQVPVVRSLGALGWARALMVSISLWGCGFLLVWSLGPVLSIELTHEVGVLAVLAIASVIYKPFASAFLAELAPASIRGIYTAIGYQCWAIGYLIGPAIGGWALDQPQPIPHRTWAMVALTSLPGLVMLAFLSQQERSASELTSEDPAV
jgi:MFS family permease